MFSKQLVVMAVVVAAVNAQGGSLSTCVIDCVTAGGLQNNCATPECVCSNQQFQADVGLCISTNCPADLPAALAAQNAECTTGSTTIVTTGAAPTTTNILSIPSISNSATGATTTGTATGASSGTVTSTSGTSTGTATTPAKSSAAGSVTSVPSSSSATGSVPSSSSETSSAASASTSSAANSLTTSSGVAAFLAMIVGFLAI